MVSKPGSSEEHNALLRDIDTLLQLVETTAGPDAGPDCGESLKVTPRGARLAINVSLRVPSANALAVMRDALRDDPRIQMVF